MAKIRFEFLSLSLYYIMMCLILYKINMLFYVGFASVRRL